MKRQNRTVGFLLVVAVLLALTIWSVHEYNQRSREVGPTEALSKAPDSIMGPEASPEESSSEPHAEAGSLEGRDFLDEFHNILNEASKCIERPELDSDPFVKTPEQIRGFFIKAYGPIQNQADKWIVWHLRSPDGREHRLRLEVAEKDGELRRELHHFVVDREGTPIPLDMDPAIALNPSDDEVNQLLKEGEVFHKESASESIYGSGERLLILEAGGYPVEFEIETKKVSVRCKDLGQVSGVSHCSCAREQEPASP